MVFANYTRKSVYSDKSDSTKNQARMSREYADLHFPGQVDSFLIYEDEAYTGSNTNRPDLKRLISDIKSGIIDVLIVYQIDRLSRNIRDFSNIYDVMAEHNVQFVSVKENIDTSTPIGRAMMFIIVVFAQMELDTTSNRIADNMTGLAKNGWWVGGNPPISYKRVQCISETGKKHVIIEPIPEEASYIEWIYDVFLSQKQSLQKLETQFKRNEIYTKNGKFFSVSQLRQILTMPYCVEATPEIYDFYKNKGCMMDINSPREKWDGKYGVMIYGRTTEKNKKHQLNPPEKWLVCIGRHKPYIKAEKWLRVQEQFTHNVFDKSMKYDVPLLKGVLRCSCGRLMSVSRKKKNKGISSWYYCPRRVRQGIEYCDRSQIKIDLLDEKVIDIFRDIEHDPSLINKYLNRQANGVKHIDIKSLNRQYLNIETKIKQLAENLATVPDSPAVKYIVAEMERLDSSLADISHQIATAQAAERFSKQEELDTNKKQEIILNLLHNFDGFTPSERNRIARSVIKDCVWDGNELFVTL